jgi:hypothetical protein
MYLPEAKAIEIDCAIAQELCIQAQSLSQKSERNYPQFEVFR